MLRLGPPAPGAFTTLTASTPAFGDSSTSVATTAFVANATDGIATISTTGGTVTLTQAQASAAGLIVTGILTANAILVVPNAGLLVVANRTSGPFGVTVKTANGTGQSIAQGSTEYLFADGTNVVRGDTDFTSAPVAGIFTTLAANTPSAGDSSANAATTAFVANAVGANVKDYVVGAMQSGTGTSSLRLLIHYLPHAITLPAGLSGSGAVALTAATASTAYVLAYRRSGTTTTIATFTFAASGTTATISGVTIPTLAAGDVLLLTGPATADTTLADVGFSILGVKQ